MLKMMKVATCVLAVAAVLPAQEAKAVNSMWSVMNPGVFCQGSSGFGSQYFYFSPSYVENTSADTQYINCSAPYQYTTDAPQVTDGSTGVQMEGVFFNSSMQAADLTCAGLIGINGLSSTVTHQVAGTFNFVAGKTSLLQWPTTDLPIIKPYALHMGMNCALPPGFRVLTFNVNQPRNF